MRRGEPVNRRDFLRLSVATAFGAGLFTACAPTGASMSTDAAVATEIARRVELTVAANRGISPVSAVQTAAPTVASQATHSSARPTVVSGSATGTPGPTTQTLTVGNTDGDGVSIRSTIRPERKIRAWPDGTAMTVVGADQTVDGRVWKNVRDPAGNVGWVPSEYLVVTTARAASAASPPRNTSASTASAGLNEPRRLGPIRDATRDEEYTAQITLQDVKWSQRSLRGRSTAKTGFTYMTVYVKIENLGPGTMRGVSGSLLEVLDSSMTLTSRDMLEAPEDCELYYSKDMLSGGSMSGCIAYQVPSEGKLELVYAPYKYEGMKPGRYLSFLVRP